MTPTSPLSGLLFGLVSGAIVGAAVVLVLRFDTRRALAAGRLLRRPAALPATLRRATARGRVATGPAPAAVPAQPVAAPGFATSPVDAMVLAASTVAAHCCERRLHAVSSSAA